MVLDAIPEYLGNDKPERGKSSKTDQFIVPAKKPFGVVMKDNPKYNENDRAAAASRKEIYKVPRRLFVRWVDQRPNEEPKPQAAPSTSSKAPPPPTRQNPPGPSTPIPGKPSVLQTKHANVMKSYREAKTEGRVHEVYQWADQQHDFAQHQRDEQADAYHDALARCQTASVPPDDDSIQF
jgi:hypothetical protein